MQMLFLQTLGLLLAAYFLGAFFGCLIRRVFFAGQAVVPAKEETQAEPLPAAPAAIDIPPEKRFKDALDGPGSQSASAGSPEPQAKPLPASMAGILPAAGGSTGQGSVAAMVSVGPEPQPATSDDLTLIRGIDAALQQRLAELGVARFADIAGWKASDVARMSNALGMKGRIASENWVEQAQILAKGGVTRYVRERMTGVALAQPSEHEGTPKTIVTGAPKEPRVEELAAFAAPATGAQMNGAGAAAAAAAAALAAAAAAVSQSAVSDRPATGVRRDDLKRIAGVNTEVEKLLNVQGISRFDQIGTWGPDDVVRFDRLLGRDGRIAAENWIEQAQILARGGQTAFSRERERQSDTIRPARLIDGIRDAAVAGASEPSERTAADHRSDLATLRSVRSEAYKSGDEGPLPADDLKRIRGIGLLIERRLAALGITSYEQIANWSDGDVDRVSQSLDFRGRIERENWIEQARILASGGQTEFSRRVDRGDVESSRSRTD